MTNLIRTAPRFEVGSGVSIHGYSDINPATVIEVSPTGKRIKVRECSAKLLNGPDSGEPDALKFSVGGFAAHVSGTQRYDITENPEGIVTEYSLRTVTRERYIDGKRQKVKVELWKRVGESVGNSTKSDLSEGRTKFYDYNF